MQIGFVGPRITTPWRPETCPEAAAPANVSISARAASEGAAKRTTVTVPR
jgi:hypothetical protein